MPDNIENEVSSDPVIADPVIADPDSTNSVITDSNIDGSWTDLFFQVLVAPTATFAYLLDDKKPPPAARAVFSSFGTVALASVVSGLASISVQPLLTVLVAIGCAIGGAINWLCISWMLYFVAGWIAKHHLPFKTCLVACGWAFLPMVFVAPITCFREVLGTLYPVVACLPYIWIVGFAWLVIKHAIQCEDKKLLMVILLGPPVILSALAFWAVVAVFAIFGLGTDTTG